MKDKKQVILTGLVILFSLIFIFEFFLYSTFKKETRVQKTVKDLKMDVENVFSNDMSSIAIDKMFEEEKKLKKELKDKIDFIEFQKSGIESENRRLTDKIKKILTKMNKIDFNINLFDQELIKTLGKHDIRLDLGTGPVSLPLDVKEYTFSNQKGKIKKAIIEYESIKYNIRNVDFLEFSKALKIIEEEIDYINLDSCIINKNHMNEGNVDIEVVFFVFKSIKGKTSKGREVEILG